MKELDKLLTALPKYINTPEGKAWLILGPWEDGWQAAYVGDGYAERSFHTYGDTPLAALKELEQNINLLRLGQ